MRIRRSLAGIAAGVLLAGLAGCTLFGPRPAEVGAEVQTALAADPTLGPVTVEASRSTVSWYLYVDVEREAAPTDDELGDLLTAIADATPEGVFGYLSLAVQVDDAPVDLRDAAARIGVTLVGSSDERRIEVRWADVEAVT